MISVAVTAVASLLAVSLGGIITTRAQLHIWRRDHDGKWRDIRLARYIAFVEATREYIAYVLQPDAAISAIPRPRPPYDLMPRLDGAGAAYTQRLDAAKTAVKLVSSSRNVIDASRQLVHRVRDLAATRATTAPESIPGEVYERVFSAERDFVNAARAELGTNAASARTIIPIPRLTEPSDAIA